jgi:protoporphyrinogen oxidase
MTASQQPHVVILGGGPAGVGGAFQLRRTHRAAVTLIESQAVVGGNAGSFDLFGQRADFGSHRLHHACDARVLADIKALLGDDLRDRVRHGRILLRGKYLHFPLKPVDLMLHLDRRFAAGTVRDLLATRLLKRDEGDTFASVLLANLGPTICQHFYFPYARKIWGKAPEQLSAISARKRVSAGSFQKLMRRLVRPPGAGRFYYPRRGYGQISEAYAEAAQDQGAELMLGWRVTALRAPENGRGRWTVAASRDGTETTIEADHVWSTIPVTLAARMLAPAAPEPVIEAAGQIDYRAMILVYLQLDVDQFTPTDAHYFPEPHIAMTRLSEPKNYWGHTEPKGSTALCAEVPCEVGDELWNMTDEALGARVVADIRTAGLPLAREPIAVTTRRLRQAYPIYSRGYERPFRVLDEWAGRLPNFLSYGRQGLFAHDNLHHALFMAYSAVDCLDGGCFDQEKWARYRETFAAHVVED